MEGNWETGEKYGQEKVEEGNWRRRGVGRVGELGVLGSWSGLGG